MATWTDTPAFVRDQVLGYQTVNTLYDNDLYLYQVLLGNDPTGVPSYTFYGHDVGTGYHESVQVPSCGGFVYQSAAATYSLGTGSWGIDTVTRRLAGAIYHCEVGFFALTFNAATDWIAVATPIYGSGASGTNPFQYASFGRNAANTCDVYVHALQSGVWATRECEGFFLLVFGDLNGTPS